MKRMIIVLTGMLTILNCEAQLTPYEGPAKVSVKSVQEGIIKLERSVSHGGSQLDAAQLESLRNKIYNIKKIDASYDITGMESKAKTLGEKIEQQKKEREAEFASRNNYAAATEANNKKVNSLLSLIFDASIGDHTPVNIQAKTEGIKKNTQELLALDRSENKALLDRFLARLKKRATEADGFYPGLEKNSKERTDAVQAAVDFYMFRYYQAYWDAAQKIFPGEAGFNNTYSLTTKIVDGLGSVENMLALTAKNYTQKVKDTRVPVAKVKDAALEKLFMESFDKMYGGSFNGKAIKAVVVSDDWIIQRNELTGIVTGRLRKGVVVYKNNIGKCFLVQEFFIQQEYVGSSFTNTRSVYAVGKGQEMLCENVQ